MGSKEAVVTTSPSPTTPGTTEMVRTLAVGEDGFDLVVEMQPVRCIIITSIKAGGFVSQLSCG